MGEDGKQGLKGDMGKPGLRGPTGDPGYRGFIGTTGDIGEKGCFLFSTEKSRIESVLRSCRRSRSQWHRSVNSVTDRFFMPSSLIQMVYEATQVKKESKATEVRRDYPVERVSSSVIASIRRSPFIAAP